MTVLHELLDDRQSLVDRDGKADALIVGFSDLCRVDAYNLSIFIDQGAAGVTGVDGCIHLDIAGAVRRTGIDIPVQARNHTAGCGTCQNGTARVADGDDPVTPLQFVRVAELRIGQVAGFDLQHCQVGIRIRADQLCRIGIAVFQDYCDASRILNHMGIGDDITISCHDNAGTGAGRGEAVAEGVALNSHYCRADLLDDFLVRELAVRGDSCIAVRRGVLDVEPRQSGNLRTAVILLNTAGINGTVNAVAAERQRKDTNQASYQDRSHATTLLAGSLIPGRCAALLIVVRKVPLIGPGHAIRTVRPPVLSGRERIYAVIPALFPLVRIAGIAAVVIRAGVHAAIAGGGVSAHPFLIG